MGNDDKKDVKPYKRNAKGRTFGHEKREEKLSPNFKNQKTAGVIQQTERNVLLSSKNKNSNGNSPEEFIKLKGVSDVPRKISASGNSAIRVLTRGVYNYGTDKDMKKTLDNMRDLGAVTVVPAVDVVMSGLSRSMRSSYASESKLCTIDELDIKRTRATLESMGEKPVFNSFIKEDDLNRVNTYLKANGKDEITAYKLTGNKKDFIRLEKELFTELRKEKLLGAGGSAFSAHNVNKAKLIKLLNSGNLTEHQKRLVNELIKVGRANQLNPKVHRRLRRLLSKRVRRYLSQSDAGKGLADLMTAIIRGRMILMANYKTICNLYSAIHLAHKHAVLLMKRAFNEKLREKLAKEFADTPVGDFVDAVNKHKKKAEAKKQNKKPSRFDKFKEQIKARIDNLKNKFENSMVGKKTAAIRHPWKRFKNTGLYKRMANSKVGTFLGKVTSGIRNVFSSIASGISSIVSGFVSFLSVFGWIIFFFILVVLIILAGFFYFEFGSQEEEYKIAALEQIQKSYQEELDKIEGLRNSNEYYLVTGPEFIDYRNEEIYEEYMPDTLVESTNAAEILSMAVVYFDFDLEDAGKKEVKEYVRKLYNGSHNFQIKVTPEQYQTTDANGETIVKERKKAHVIIKTHYFDTLFDCQLSNIAATLTEGSEVIITDQRAQMWTSTGYDYWLDTHKPMIWASGTNQRAVADEWKAKGSVFTDGIATIDGRALVAVSQALGRPGDYIDAYFEDGHILPCIVADAKSMADENITEFGHVSGGQLSVLEFEVQYDRYWRHRPTAYNPGSGPAGNRWEPFSDTGLKLRDDNFVANRVIKIVNGGPNPPETNNVTGDKVVKYAKKQVGKPIVDNGASPDEGFDASGLVQYCYKKAGIDIPRTASEQINQGNKVSIPSPGDIVVEGGAVGIYIGNGQMIHAPRTASTVSIKNVGHNVQYVRY